MTSESIGSCWIALPERLRPTAGTSQQITVDNGLEFISKALDAWVYQNGVQLEFSGLGKPTDNAFV